MYQGLNDHFIYYLLERVAENSSIIRFMERNGQYRDYPYPVFWSDVKKYAAYLTSQGAKTGDVICLLLPTCEEFLAAFFAAQLIKAVPVSLYPPTSLMDVKNWKDKSSQMIAAVGSQHLITNKRISAFAQKLADDGKLQVHSVETIENTQADYAFDIENYHRDDICFLQFSSGTTGMPKPVMVKQSNAIINAYLIREALPAENEKISVACWLPLYHDMGLVGCLLMSILNGTDLILIRPEDFITKPRLWLQAMHDYKLTCTTAPNFAYGLVQKRVSAEELKGLDLSGVRAMLCGAEVVYKETMDKFTKHMSLTGLEARSVLPVYGMAEATLAVSFTKREQGMRFITVDKTALEEGKVTISEEGIELCSVGELLESFALKIIDSNGNELTENKVGRILLKGPCISEGYYLDSTKTQEMFIDEWLDTGDEGFVHKGQLYICGRLKDTIIIRGKNYYPTVYEEKMCEIAGIRKGRAIVSSCYQEAIDSEEVVVLAEVDSPYALTHEGDEIKRKISQLISAEGLPLHSVTLYPPGVLLKTSSGKLRRRENLKRWQENTLGASKDSWLGALSWRQLYASSINALGKVLSRQ